MLFFVRHERRESPRNPRYNANLRRIVFVILTRSVGLGTVKNSFISEVRLLDKSAVSTWVPFVDDKAGVMAPGTRVTGSSASGHNGGGLVESCIIVKGGRSSDEYMSRHLGYVRTS